MTSKTTLAACIVAAGPAATWAAQVGRARVASNDAAAFQSTHVDALPEHASVADITAVHASREARLGNVSTRTDNGRAHG